MLFVRNIGESRAVACRVALGYGKIGEEITVASARRFEKLTVHICARIHPTRVHDVVVPKSRLTVYDLQFVCVDFDAVIMFVRISEFFCHSINEYERV